MRITDRDRELLAFAAEHRLVLAGHVQARMHSSAAVAYHRLRSLTGAGLLSHRTIFHREPGCYQITRHGLAAIKSDLPPPRIDLRCYRHDVGVAWLWLAAREGAFGPHRELLAERTMRSLDANADARSDTVADPLAVRLAGIGPGGRRQLHYPDLMLVQSGGRRIAVELELSLKGRTRREGILAGYGADRRVGAVLYLTDNRSVAQAICSAAAGMGVAPLVHVHHLSWTSGHRTEAARVPARLQRRGELTR